MTRWFTSFFILIVLVASVPAGVPFLNGGMDKEVCPMKCCKKKEAKAEKPKPSEVAICRTINCSIPMPTSKTATSQINFTPNLVLSETQNFFEILFSNTPKESVRFIELETDTLVTLQPKYIQHKSLLI